MKTSCSPIIWTVICLLPTLLAGQAIQKHSPLLVNDASLRALQLNSMQSVTESPLLRISNIGSSGQDGVSIELNSLSLTSPGPTMLFDCPDPLIPGSGAIRLQPSSALSSLRLTNIGSSGQDGVAIDLGEAVVGTYRPRMSMRKPLVAGTQSAIIIEPGEDSPYLSITNIGSSGQDGVQLTYQDEASDDTFFETYDLILGSTLFGFDVDAIGFGDVSVRTIFDVELPGLMERIASTSLDSFFDVFYDLHLGTVGTGFGQNPNNICAVRTFDPTTPSLLERISSNLPTVESFFDVFVDLNAREHTHRVGILGDPDFDLLRIQSYEIDTPRILERIETTIGPWTERFFDITYDLDLGVIGRGFGNNPDNICAITKFNPMTPSVRERIQASGDDSFFDVFTDLNARSQTHKVGIMGDPDFDLLRIQSYEIDTPRIFERIETTIGPWTESFFDITYDLDLGVMGRGFGNNPDNICAISTFDPVTPKLSERISASNLDRFFDVFYDLNLGIVGTGFGNNPNNICAVITFDPVTPSLLERISSNLPTVESFFDVFVDLELGTETHRLGTPGLPLSYLAVTRKFDKATPKLLEKIASGDPLYADHFFDIEYNLELGTHTTEHNGLKYLTQYNESEWDFISRVTSNDPLIGFHEQIVDLNEMSLSNSHSDNDGGWLEFKWIYDPNGPEGTMVVASGNASLSSFVTSYDLSIGTHTMKHNGGVYEQKFFEGGDKYAATFSSNLPGQNSFGTTTVVGGESPVRDIRLAGFVSSAPLEMRYEYDGLNRRVREITTDTDNGATLLLDRRLSPSGSRLLVGGSLSIEGGTLTASPPGAPLILEGNVIINGSLQVAPGPKAFKIDHPLDPDNKYLIHSCIESPDMMNIYNGNVVTDASGYATIILPEYFEALNNDFRYQLTCMGQFAQAIVDQKIKANRFVIRTDKPNVEVSWQVTGIRHDPGSKRESYTIEIDKEPEMKGKRLYQQ